MRHLAVYSFVLLSLAGCVTQRPTVRPREVIGHAATGNIVILLARTTTDDGAVHIDMEVSVFPYDPLEIKAGRNLEFWVDGKRFQLVSRGPGVAQTTTSPLEATLVNASNLDHHQRISARHAETNGAPFRPEQFESVWYTGLPQDFVAAVGRATAVKARLTGTKGVQNFELTRVLLRQFHDWAD